MFKKGDEYELSFDYKCSAALPITLDIQQNYMPFSSYFSKSVNCSTETQHYKGTFIVSNSDNNCALAFSIGGQPFNGSVVTINNMSLVLKNSSKVNKPTIRNSAHLLRTFCYDSKRGVARLNLANAVNINLRLYSILGREVFNVVEKKNAGEYSYHVKNIGLAPGMYIGQIKAGNEAIQWKMTIEK